MKAAVMRAAHQPLSIEDVHIDEPGPREVLVKTAACGVCHSDLHFIEGEKARFGGDFFGRSNSTILQRIFSVSRLLFSHNYSRRLFWRPVTQNTHRALLNRERLPSFAHKSYAEKSFEIPQQKSVRAVNDG